MKTIGVLALQGAFIEHVDILNKINKTRNILIRNVSDIDLCDGVIIPGGESTAMGIIEDGIFDKLRECMSSSRKLPIWGTCAGLILLADRILNPQVGIQKNIGGLHVSVTRNYFGAQVHSFVEDISTPIFEYETFSAIFIRAPVIAEIQSSDVEILCKTSKGDIVAVIQNDQLLGTCFHPELDPTDSRWHEYFIKLLH